MERVGKKYNVNFFQKNRTSFKYAKYDRQTGILMLVNWLITKQMLYFEFRSVINLIFNKNHIELTEDLILMLTHILIVNFSK